MNNDSFSKYNIRYKTFDICFPKAGGFFDNKEGNDEYFLTTCGFFGYDVDLFKLLSQRYDSRTAVAKMMMHGDLKEIGVNTAFDSAKQERGSSRYMEIDETYYRENCQLPEQKNKARVLKEDQLLAEIDSGRHIFMWAKNHYWLHIFRDKNKSLNINTLQDDLKRADVDEKSLLKLKMAFAHPEEQKVDTLNSLWFDNYGETYDEVRDKIDDLMYVEKEEPKRPKTQMEKLVEQDKRDIRRKLCTFIVDKNSKALKTNRERETEASETGMQV